ncbi:MAG TPA: chitobiase/beta-hexosaminidase C-terminal domain-containing protein, partial [Polyangiales bacterium]|nr:chitobiase/beta-hexosaminidase C-terminal domain-containing protein [Polyangiales bacterium]
MGMGRLGFACGVWFLAIAACGVPGVTSVESDKEIPARPLPDAGSGLPPQVPPVLDEDSGIEEQPDAASKPAADGGGTDSGLLVQPEPTEPVMEPVPTPPPEPPPLTVSFEPPGGGFSAPIMVNLRGADPEAVVHYTLDGTVPSSSSPVASTALRIENTTLLRAVAVRDGRFGPSTNHAYF